MNDEDARAVRGAYPGSVRRFGAVRGPAAASDAAPGGRPNRPRASCRRSSSRRRSAPKTSRTSRSAYRRSAARSSPSIMSPTTTTSPARCPASRSPPARDRVSTTSRSRRQLHVGSATVGIYIDEVSVTISNSQFDGAVQPKLFDLDRIEVLRGPQGTLYGASSMAAPSASSPSSRISIPSAPRRVPTCP